jgi:AraC family transcriptional regulator of adaptative response/methylated-DNA-[protein]-cysteine methyltransferase
MYRALLNRDTTFEGVFYVAVKTTGIFCRPTCTAKKPKIENVEFFASPSEALYAGYRPCLRCNPLERNKQAPEIVRRLCKIIDEKPAKKIDSAELRSLGIDPSTARRQFQRHYGMTFQAYHRARRMGLALHEIRNGESVIGAQIDSGFESASGFWEAFKQLFGTPPRDAKKIKYLQASWYETPLGVMVAMGDSDGVYLLEFVDRRGLENEILQLRKRTGCVIVPGSNAHLEKLGEELKNYFNGSKISFTVPLIIGGTAFEQTVWKHLRSISPGETWSYLQLARKVGKPTATRAVGHANGKNCLALVIPCHRVIGADGRLSGYGGGIWRKKWLIEHERQVMQKK